jgi:hypothetical protein
VFFRSLHDTGPPDFAAMLNYRVRMLLWMSGNSRSITSTAAAFPGSVLSSVANIPAHFNTRWHGFHGFSERSIVRAHVADLVNDWLALNGWKFRLVGVWLPGSKTLSPFGAVPERWKVYQLALEDTNGFVEYG